jgi:hypothetical protein
MITTTDVTIRTAVEADCGKLRRLAALDSARPLAGDALVAEVAGEPVAAIEIATGRTIADPFRPTAVLADLLHRRATALGAPAARRRRRLVLRPYRPSNSAA